MAATKHRLRCPLCKSSKIWKDGIRYTKDGEVQRYICRECGHRFSETSLNKSDSLEHVERVQTKKSYSSYGLPSICQVSVTETQGAKNLVEVETRTEKWAAGATRTSQADIKGKIVEFLWWMKKQGYAKSTIEGRVKLLKRLVRLGADLYNPESVKEVIAKQEKWSEGRKELAVEAYSSYLTMVGGKWDPPKYKRIRKLPFIPTEADIDQLIAGCGKKMSAFLQLLKETAIRAGEAWKLQWTDIDYEKRTVRITPEKGSNPRIFKVSQKLLDMLSTLPKSSQFVFGKYHIRGFASSYRRSRKRLARKLGNPRLLQITFHTFRHWKATMEYHKTRDILHVMRFLGHKNIKNTLIYTQLIDLEEDEYVCKVAENIEEAKQLIEDGFEYVCDMDTVKLFRKRK